MDLLFEIIERHQFQREPVFDELARRNIDLTPGEERIVDQLTYEGNNFSLAIALEELQEARRLSMRVAILNIDNGTYAGVIFYKNLDKAQLILGQRNDPYFFERSIIAHYRNGQLENFDDEINPPGIVFAKPLYRIHPYRLSGDNAFCVLYFFRETCFIEYDKDERKIDVYPDYDYRMFLSNYLHISAGEPDPLNLGTDSYDEDGRVEFYYSIDDSRNIISRFAFYPTEDEDVSLTRSRIALDEISAGSLPQTMLSIIGEEDRVRQRRERYTGIDGATYFQLAPGNP